MTTRLLAAVVGALVVLCALGGAVAAYVVDRVPAREEPAAGRLHRQPRNPCDLLSRQDFGAPLGGPLEATRQGRRGECDFLLRDDGPRPAGAELMLRLSVDVGPRAAAAYDDAQRSGPGRVTAKCGQRASVAHRYTQDQQVVEGWLWCVDRDVYLTLDYQGYEHDGWNSQALDGVLAALGGTAIAGVPKA